VIFENSSAECKLLPALASLMQVACCRKNKNALRQQVINAIVIAIKIFAINDPDVLVKIYPTIKINQTTVLLLLLGSLRILAQ